ncbi:MAG: nuclear transport factor 2 family protein [Burkholderiaceae bacterium]|jgi:hypothetical protein|nr:nuclear transport factor 2 family protein [Burkholderiaceae bacterium]
MANASPIEIPPNEASTPLSAQDIADLTALEEAMWRAETRFDRAFMERALSADFCELGRSGRTYTREQALAIGPEESIKAMFPLPNLRIRLLAPDVAQLTYDSRVEYEGQIEHAHRSSIWTRSAAGWQLRFHQGTPFEPHA